MLNKNVILEEDRMNSIDILVAEHDRILQMTQLVDRIGVRIMQGERIPADDFRSMISFIRIYADRLHHSKEEKILFREMEARLGELAQRLIRNGMLAEHEIARYHVGEWEQAVNRWEQSQSSEDLHAILIHSGAWADLLRRHIDKENDAVYPFGMRQLAPEICEQIEAESVALDEENGEDRQKMLALFDQLLARYPEQNP